MVKKPPDREDSFSPPGGLFAVFCGRFPPLSAAVLSGTAGIFQKNAAAVDHGWNHHGTEQGCQQKIQRFWASDDSKHQGSAVQQQNKKNASQGQYAPYIQMKSPSFRI